MRNQTSLVNRVQYLTIFVLSLWLAACATEHLESAPPPTVNEFALDNNYRIGVGDDLQVQVWRNEELSAHVPVRPDGKISSPLVGDIVAAGLTTTKPGQSDYRKARQLCAQPGSDGDCHQPLPALIFCGVCA